MKTKVEMKRVNIRLFSRKLYFFIKELPIIVYNKKTGIDLFTVIKGGGRNGNSIQSKR